MQTLRKTRGRYLMVLVAMCGLIAANVGIINNTAGLFFTPVAEELHTDTSAVNLTLTIINLVFAVAGMISAQYVRARNFKLTLAICTAILAASTAALSLCRSLVPMYLLSAIRGLSGGMMGNVLANKVISRWFLSDTGLISSLVLSSSGLAGALFNPLLEAVIRTTGWRMAYVVSGGVILLLNLPAIFLPITFLPEDAGLVPLDAGGGGRNHVGPQNGRDCKNPLAPVLAAFIFSITGFACAMPQLFKSLALTYGFQQTGILMMTIVLVMNTCGKYFFGAMTDSIGMKRSTMIYGTVIAVGILLLYFVRQSTIMLISAGMIGLCYSVPTVGAVMFCRELFSLERFGRIYPNISLCITLANALGYPLLGLIYDRTGSYNAALILCLVLTLLSMVSVILVYRMADREQA